MLSTASLGRAITCAAINLAESFDARLPCFHRRFHRRDVAFDDDRDISAAEFFFAEDFDVGGFSGRIQCFKYSRQPLCFNQAGCAQMIRSWVFFLGQGKSRGLIWE